MMSIRVTWTVPNTYWEGDDYSGKRVRLGPDFVHVADLLQFVVTPEGITRGVVLENGKFHTVDIDDLTAVARQSSKSGEAK